jgi:hypothetical protein
MLKRMLVSLIAAAGMLGAAALPAMSAHSWSWCHHHPWEPSCYWILHHHDSDWDDDHQHHGHHAHHNDNDHGDHKNGNHEDHHASHSGDQSDHKGSKGDQDGDQKSEH